MRFSLSQPTHFEVGGDIFGGCIYSNGIGSGDSFSAQLLHTMLFSIVSVQRRNFLGADSGLLNYTGCIMFLHFAKLSSV